VTFYGSDQGQLQQLQDLISLNGLEDRLVFAGFVNDVHQIWERNHALLLPSRYEGAALVVIEAMLCNRMGIVTDTGRNRELIDDGETGFVADGPIVKLIDDALERAWTKRSQWRAMGQLAGQRIRNRYPRDPIRQFTDRLLNLL
jgi:glycosyltransferase involved in cell wall biosynthesis